MPMFASPVIGFVAAALFMLFLYAILKKTSPRFVNRVFGKLQLVSAAWMGFSHGSNDAQKNHGHHRPRPLHRHAGRRLQ